MKSVELLKYLFAHYSFWEVYQKIKHYIINLELVTYLETPVKGTFIGLLGLISI